MASRSGGVAAAFGFRYQYLVTVEELLDLYQNALTPRWRVGVDLHEQDSADVLVFADPSGPPSRAIQVKASMPSSATKMDLSTARRCLDALGAEHPSATALILVTNRELNAPAAQLAATLQQQAGGHSREIIDGRTDDVSDIVLRLVGQIALIRARGKGGLGPRLHRILLAQLIDLVLERGSQTAMQYIDLDEVAAILDESAAVLADATGVRSWGRVFGTPTGAYVPRPAIEDFLNASLLEDALYSGAPAVAMLSGLQGAGKSAAVASWAASRREHYAFSLWIDATSSHALAEQVPAILRWLGAGVLTDDPAQEPRRCRSHSRGASCDRDAGTGTDYKAETDNIVVEALTVVVTGSGPALLATVGAYQKSDQLAVRRTCPRGA